MNRTEAEDFIYKSYLKAEKHQDYKAQDSEKRRPDLTREIIRKKSVTPSVVVTGSKGKGSVSNMISRIMQTSCRVGLMTSPHLISFCERFKINDDNISDEDFAKYVSIIRPEIDKIDEEIPNNVCISPMGIQTDLALTYFNDQRTDFNIFECGKGAKYDDVNNALHDYAVINSIFLEHTRELGSTLEAIAADKSHVITGEQKCVFVAEQDPSVMSVIANRAQEYDTILKIYGRDFLADRVRFSNSGMVFDVIVGDKKIEDITIPLLGVHQAKNCALALALALEVLGDVDEYAVKEKLLNINWPGRMEVLSGSPFIMLDACINKASCGNVKEVMNHLGIDMATVIIGIPDDKDYQGVVKEMSSVAETIILTKSQNPHYIFTSEQCEKMESEGIHTVWTESIEDALRKAKQTGISIVILGTTSVVSEVKELQISNNL